MLNQIVKIFPAVALEVVFGVFVMLRFNCHLWWLGLLAGLGGYASYELIGALAVAGQCAIGTFEIWKPDRQAKVVIGAIVFALTSIVAGWWLFFSTTAPVLYALALSTSLFSSIVAVVALPIAYPIGLPNRGIQDDKDFFTITLVCNPMFLTLVLAMGLFASPFALVSYFSRKHRKA
jgi:hypothetical protein